MGYADEEIVKVMNSHKKSQYGDIYHGIYMEEERIEFEKRELFNGKMNIMLPNKFTDMPLELAKLKYPMEQRPQIILSNESGNVNFTFSILDVALEQKNVKEVKDGFYHIIKSAQPANVFYDNKAEKINETVIGWFDYKSHGVDQKIYNLMYCMSIDGKLLHGIFNSSMKNSKLWKPVVLQVIHSIQDLSMRKEE